MNTSPESDPIKELQALTAKAGEALDDDAAFDAAVNEINKKLLVEELMRLDELIGITEQYEYQLAVLRDTWFMRKLSDGTEGIVGAGGNWHPAPSLLSIVQRFYEDEKKYELLRRKVEQGFRELIMVPFASRLNDLPDAYAYQLRQHKLDCQLFGEEEPSATSSGKVAKVLNLNTAWPVKKFEEYQIQELVYFPTSFAPQNHGGFNKEEAVVRKGAWQVYLIEETFIPRKGDGLIVNGRKQLEAGLTPRQYLELLQTDPQYSGEIGLTPELWLMRALTHLKKKNQVTDDFRGKGSINCNLSTYLEVSDTVPCAYWSRDSYLAYLDTYKPDSQDESIAASTAVMI